MKKKLKLALLLVTTLLLGTSQNQEFLIPTSFGNSHVVLADTKSKSKNEDKATKAAKKAIKKLEKEQTQENLDLANKKVKVVKNKNTKKS